MESSARINILDEIPSSPFGWIKVTDLGDNIITCERNGN